MPEKSLESFAIDVTWYDNRLPIEVGEIPVVAVDELTYINLMRRMSN